MLWPPPWPAFASDVLTVAPPRQITARRGQTFPAALRVELRGGFHVNSNAPADEYLIPLRLAWEVGPLQAVEVVFPKPRLEKYGFSPKPVSVFTGDFDIATNFRVAADAPTGLHLVKGKLRYQACNDKLCLPPKTLEVQLAVDIR